MCTGLRTAWADQRKRLADGVVILATALIPRRRPSSPTPPLAPRQKRAKIEERLHAAGGREKRDDTRSRAALASIG